MLTNELDLALESLERLSIRFEKAKVEEDYSATIQIIEETKDLRNGLYYNCRLIKNTSYRYLIETVNSFLVRMRAFQGVNFIREDIGLL